MRKLKVLLALAVAAVSAVALATPASAQAGDAVVKAGTVAGAWRHGTAAVKYATGLEVVRNPAGELIDVRATATVAKWSRATWVQVDSVRLATDRAVVLANTKAANSGPAALANTTTAWRAIAPSTCTSYRVRAYFSVRWADGALGRYTALSPLTKVCGPSSPPRYASCASLNLVFPHGVGRAGAHDVVRGSTAPVTNFYISSYIYSANPGRDGDGDGVACERH